MKNKALLIEVELLRGFPDFRLDENVDIHISGDIIVLSWNSNTLTGKYLGKFAGKGYFLGCGSENILIDGLVHLGTNVVLLKNISKQLRNWLLTRTDLKKVKDKTTGNILSVIPPAILAGEIPEHIAMDDTSDQYLNEDDYDDYVKNKK